MTLEQFKKNLELVNQIETIKKQRENNKYILAQNNKQNSQNFTQNNINTQQNIDKNKNFFEKTGDWLSDFGSNIFQKPKAFDDGYDFGDVTKTILGSAADAGLNAYNAVASMMEGIPKLAGAGIAQVADWAGNDEFADSMREQISDPNNDAFLSPKVNEFREKYIEPYSVLGSSSDKVASGIGSTIGASALSVIPGVGNVSLGKMNVPLGMGIAEMGNSVAENYSKEDVTDAQAWLNGAGSGVVSAISEGIFGAFGVGGSELDDVLVKSATKNLKSQLAKSMAKTGIKAGGEAAEEFLEYAGGYLTNLATDEISQGKGAQFFEEWNNDELFDNMASAFISTSLSQGLGDARNIANGNDVVTGNSRQVQTQIDQEVQSEVQALQDKGEKVSIPKQIEIENRVSERIQLNNAKQELTDIVNKSESIDNSLKKGILSKIDSIEDFKNLNLLSNMIDTYESRNIDNKNIGKNILSNKLAKNNNSLELLAKNEISKDSSRQAFIDSAKSNNIDVDNNTQVLDSMFEMAYQRGVNISIDGKVFSNNNQNALWRVNNQTGQREVIINPNNPSKALQNITIHEMTHDMENSPSYQQLSKVVLDYAKKQNNYDSAFKELSNMYAEEYKNYNGVEFENRINQEMVADILGEKLGNQEFVNSIVTSNRGVAQNIYTWIVDKLNRINKLTGYKFEKLYWADVKNKFDNAFNSQFNNIDNDVKYAKKGDIIDNKNKIWYNKNGIRLTNKENYQISSYINTNFSKMEIGTEFAKEVGDYLYIGQKASDGEFKYYAKIQIEGNENRIDNIKRSIKEDGINGKRKSFSKSIQVLRNVRGTNSSDASSSSNRGTSEQIDRLYSRQSEDNNFKPNTTQSIGNKSRGENNQGLAPTSSFLSKKTDNKGRQLSQQQQEYFKDSKVRDGNGNLLTVYHGTNNEFNVFERRTNDARGFAPGFYFTIDKSGADSYSNYDISKTKEVYLNIKKPINGLDEKPTNITLKQVQDIYSSFNKETKINEEYLKNNSSKSVLNNIFYDLQEQLESNPIENYDADILQKFSDITGYDGVYENGTYVAFQPNQIKNVDNTNPTNSDDIRYSKSSNGVYQQFLQDNFSNNGTKIYMKDIKLPTNISNLKDELRSMVDNSTDMDSQMKNSLKQLINNTSTESELQSFKEDLKSNTNSQQASVKSGTITVNDYKNAKLNSIIVDNALSMVESNNRGKRTKNQWLQVAEQIGMNIKENEIEKYAYKTWSDLRPNLKSNLNRQSERYVPFSKNEWIKAVEDGYYKANLEVKGIDKEDSKIIEKVIEDKNISSKTSDELWKELIDNSSEEAQELLDGRNIEIKKGIKNTRAISNDKSIEISQNGNMYLNNTKPTAEQFRNGLENHFEKGEKRLAPINKKQVQDGYKTETWNGNQWVTEDVTNKNDSSGNFLDEESSTLKYLKDSRSSDKASFNEIADSLIQKFVNRGHYIDKLAKQTNNQELKYAYDKTLSTFAEAQYAIGIAQTDSKGNEIGKSLIDIFKPVKEAGLKNQFNDYLLNRLNIERQAVEKSIFGPEITSETSRNTIRRYEKKYPQFKEWANDVYKYNSNELQNLVDAGFISKETQDLFHSMYGDYVPIHRILEETVEKASKTTKETGATSPIKRAKGGYQEILDIENAMAENVIASKKAIRMNELGIELAKSTGKSSILEEVGYQPKWTPDAIISLNGDVVLNSDGKYLYTIYTNGEMKQFNISKELFEGLRKDTLDSKIRNSKTISTLLTPIEKLTKAQRNLLTTYSVGFALNNPIKDFQDGLFYTKYGASTFLKNYTLALQEIANRGEYYKKYMALGGMDNSYFEYGTGIKTEAKGIKNLFKKIQKINGILETAPRLAEYISSIQNGATQNEAMYNAADITTNFKRGGEITKIANRYGANFLNASVQGLDKFVRTFTNLNVKSGLNLIVKVASMGVLPTLLNGLIYKDDDDYEKLEDYIKDEYYLIKISDEGDFIRIPKGRVLATISSATRTIIEGAQGDLDLKSFGSELVKQLAPNNPLEDNLIAPIKQVVTNKTWYGTDLVPTRLQNQLPKNQYNEKTDNISLWLGENLNISPIKINYLIDQYSGGLGDVILPMLTPQAENNIITDKFTTSSISKNKTVGEFYDALDEYEKLKNDSNATEEQKTKYNYLSKISSKVGELYSQKREVQMDKTLSDKDKKEIVKDIQKEINAYTECAMDNIKNEYNTENKWNMYIDGIISDSVRESDGNSALQDALYIINNGIATKEEYMDMYQLSKENNTSLPTMNTLLELKENNVKLAPYMEYKIGTKEYESTRDEYGNTIAGSLNSKKANYIMSMNIDEEQKDGLLNILSEGASYEDLKKLSGNYTIYFQQSGKIPNNGGLSAREKYMSLINAGITVEQLDKYYSQISSIEGIKNSNGKTISGSKKQAIFNFVNSLKLSAPQKMILLAKQYKSCGKMYVKEIIQYISKLKSSKKDKIKLIYSIFF